MARLTAIPVGQGDAFLLTRSNGKTVLVDGGRARSTFGLQVATVTKAIDVVVCTHADADHAEGLIGLLDASSVPISEVWLPGRWSSRLADICLRQTSFWKELSNDVLRDAGTTLEDIAEMPMPDKGSKWEFDPAALESALENAGSVVPSALDPVRYSLALPRRHPVDGTRTRLWAEAVLTATRIRDLALAAHHHGARIRWFDFDQVKEGATPHGGEPFLLPLNSVELAKGHSLRKYGALHFAALSVANRESLVFLAPETEDDSPVLFAADSDLAVGIVPTSERTMAVTAPHHGSESNKLAYATVSKTGNNVLWVRSDGNFRNRPGTTFLGQTHRVCTTCRNAGVGKQMILLDESPSGWGLAAGVRRCTCQ